MQHSNAKNAVLFEAISLIIHNDAEPNLLVRACNQLGQFLSHRLVEEQCSTNTVHLASMNSVPLTEFLAHRFV